MLYNIKTGWNGIPQLPMQDIVVMATSLPCLVRHGVPFVFTDRHAYMIPARFSSDLADLERVDWSILKRSDFARDPNDPEKVDRYQAEALVYRHLSIDMLEEVICCTDVRTAHVRAVADEAGVQVSVVTRREYFF